MYAVNNGWIDVTMAYEPYIRYRYSGTISEEVFKSIDSLSFLCEEDKQSAKDKYWHDKDLADAHKELEEYLKCP